LTGGVAVAVSVVAVALSSVVVGLVLSQATGRSPLRSALRQIVVSMLAAGVTYLSEADRRQRGALSLRTVGGGAVVLEGLRTPYGRRGGALSSWHRSTLPPSCCPSWLAGHGLEGSLVEDVVLGCTSQVGRAGHNIATGPPVLGRGAAESVPGCHTLDRQAGPLSQAVHWAAQAVMSGRRIWL